MSLPSCPTDCSGNLPAFDFSKCAPKILSGQIAKIFFTKPGYPMSNAASALEWDSRLDQDGSSANAIRTLVGIFQMPKPEQDEIEISLGRKHRGVKKFSLTGRIDELSDATWDALRTMECNSGINLVWFNTRGGSQGDNGYLYGGNSGIEATILMNPVIPEGYTEVQYIDIQITWESKYSPERIASPITDTIGDQF